MFLAGLLLCAGPPVHGAGLRDCGAPLGLAGLGTLNQPPSDMEAVGNLVYTADTMGLTIYRVEDGPPAQVGQLLLPEAALSVDVTHGRAYLADGTAGLKIVDVGNPAQPTLLGTLQPGDRVLDATGTESTVFLVTASGDLVVADVSDPSAPQVLYQGDAASGRDFAPPMALSGEVLVLLGRGGGLYTIDVSNPPAPTLLGASGFTVSTTARLAMAKGVAYVTGQFRLCIFDLRDPASPALAATFGEGWAQGVDVLDGRAYVTFRDSGLQILDVENPFQPHLLGSLQTGRTESLVAVSGGLTVLSSQSPAQGASGTVMLTAVDTRSPASPAEMGTTAVGGFTRGLAVHPMPGYSGSMAVIHDSEHLVLADLEDLQAVSVVASVDIPSPGEGWQPLGYGGRMEVAAEGGTAVLGDGLQGLLVAQIADPRSASISAQIPTTPGRVDLPTLHSGLAYFTVQEDYWAGAELRIADVSDPLHPILLGSVPLAGGRPMGLAVEGSIACVAMDISPTGPRGIQVLDVSDPQDPHVVGNFQQSGLGCYDVAVRDGVAVAACGIDGLLTVDLSDPTSPSLLGSLPTPFPAQQVELAGSVAFVHGETELVLAVNTQDPSRLQTMQSFTTRRPVRSIALDRNAGRLWVAEGSLMEAFGLSCTDCAGVSLAVDPPSILTGGESATITATVSTLAGEPVPGLDLTGQTTLGTLSTFQEQDDGSYTATLTSGQEPGRARISVSLDGVPCQAAAEVQIVCAAPVSAPESVSAEATGDGEVRISWDPVPGAVGYQVLWGGLPIAELGPGATVFLDHPVTPGSAACYRVAARGRCGDVAVSHESCTTAGGFDPRCPATASFLASGSPVLDLAETAGAVYLLTEDGGIWAVDVSDPARPHTASTLSTAASPAELAAGAGLLAVSGGSQAWVLDASDPLHPALAATVASLPENPQIALSQRTLCAAGATPEGPALQLVDLSDPALPEPAGALPLDEEVHDLAAVGTLAAAAGPTGVALVSLADPDAPSREGFFPVPGGATAVLLHRGLAAASSGSGNLVLWDVSDPANPTPRGSLALPGPADGLTADGTLVLAACGTQHAVVADISDPDNPAVLATRSQDALRGTALRREILALGAGDGLHLVTLPCRPPAPDFDSVTGPLTASFIDRSLYGPTEWTWDFGDGGQASIQDPTHAFAVPGPYTVALAAGNAYGLAVTGRQVRIPGDGDANSDGLVDVLDILDELAEIWDGDGSAAGDAAGGTHPGGPDYDVDGNGRIGAEDLAAILGRIAAQAPPVR